MRTRVVPLDIGAGRVLKSIGVKGCGKNAGYVVFGLIWGIGPIFQLPTATNDKLGSKNFDMGPSVVVLNMISPTWQLRLQVQVLLPKSLF